MLRYTIPAEAQRGGHAVFAAEGFSAADRVRSRPLADVRFADNVWQ